MPPFVPAFAVNSRSNRWFLSAAAALAVAFALEATARADKASTSIEQGYDLGETESTRSLAMGGAQNALGSSTGAVYMNPANLALASVYHFEGLAAFSPQARRQSYGGAVADGSCAHRRSGGSGGGSGSEFGGVVGTLSALPALCGGFSGTYNIQDPDGVNRRWTDLRLALAYAINDKIAFGITGRYLRLVQNGDAGPFGASFASNGTPGSPIVSNFTFDAGLSIQPTEGFHIGVVGHNLTNPGNGLMPTTVAGGMGYQSDMFAVEADLLSDFSTWNAVKERAMVGAELFLAHHVPLRVGYRYDDGMHTHSVSGGIGYVDRQFSVEASARQDIVGDHPATMIGLGLRYFYETAGAAATAVDATDGI